MEERTEPYPKLAIAVALLLLLAGGFVYRAAAARYARPSESVQLPDGALAKLSYELEDWRGRPVPLDEEIIRATKTDQHVSREYTRAAGSQRVALFVAYGVRARDLMPHRPEVCYPGAGWTAQDQRDIDLELGDGSKLPCRVLRFSRGGLAGEQILVLNYYVVDGQYSADVELLRSKIWKLSGGPRYMAQVQISSWGGTLGRSAEEAVRAFAKAAAGPIGSLFPGQAGRTVEDEG